jgi:hypothetical protein
MKLLEFVLRADLQDKRGRFTDFAEGTDPCVMETLDDFFFTGLGMYGVTEVEEVEWLGLPISLDDSAGFYLLGYYRPRKQHERGAPFHGVLIPFDSLRQFNLRVFLKAWEKSDPRQSDWIQHSKVGSIELAVENQRLAPVGESHLTSAHKVLKLLEQGHLIRFGSLTRAEIDPLFTVMVGEGLDAPLFKYAWSTVAFGLPGEPDGAYLHLSRSKDGTTFTQPDKLDLKRFSKEVKPSRSRSQESSSYQFGETPRSGRRLKWIGLALLVLIPSGYYIYQYQKLQFSIADIEKNMQPAYFEKANLAKRVEYVILAQKLVDENHLGSDTARKLILSLPRMGSRINETLFQQCLDKQKSCVGGLEDALTKADSSTPNQWYRFLRSPQRSPKMQGLANNWAAKIGSEMKTRIENIYPSLVTKNLSVTKQALGGAKGDLSRLLGLLEGYDEFKVLSQLGEAKLEWLRLEHGIFSEQDLSVKIRYFGEYLCLKPLKGFRELAAKRLHENGASRRQLVDKSFVNEVRALRSKSPISLTSLRTVFLQKFRENALSKVSDQETASWTKYFSGLETGIMVRIRLKPKLERRDFRVNLFPVNGKLKYFSRGEVFTKRTVQEQEIICPFQLGKPLNLSVLNKLGDPRLAIAFDVERLLDLLLNHKRMTFTIEGVDFTVRLDWDSNADLVPPGIES